MVSRKFDGETFLGRLWMVFDGKFDGETFLGRLWMVFLVGSGGGKRRRQGTSSGSVFAGRRAFLNRPIFYVVYYILSEQWGFRFFMLQVIADGALRASRPWADTYDVEVSTTDDLFHTLKTMWGPAALRSVTDSKLLVY
jgi:hypothetical protein